MKSSLLAVPLLGTLLLLPALPATAEEGKSPAREDKPPPELVQANAEFVCFFMSEVAGQPKQKGCEEEAAQELIRTYPSLPPDQRQQLKDLQDHWPKFLAEWNALDDLQKAAIRSQWAAMLQEQQMQEGIGGSEPPPPTE